MRGRPLLSLLNRRHRIRRHRRGESAAADGTGNGAAGPGALVPFPRSAPGNIAVAAAAGVLTALCRLRWRRVRPDLGDVHDAALLDVVARSFGAHVSLLSLDTRAVGRLLSPAPSRPEGPARLRLARLAIRLPARLRPVVCVAGRGARGRAGAAQRCGLGGRGAALRFPGRARLLGGAGGLAHGVFAAGAIEGTRPVGCVVMLTSGAPAAPGNCVSALIGLPPDRPESVSGTQAEQSHLGPPRGPGHARWILAVAGASAPVRLCPQGHMKGLRSRSAARALFAAVIVTIRVRNDHQRAPYQ